MKRLFLFSILIVLVSSSQALSLYSLMDPYAAEVLLNRNGIAYNLEFIKTADNVSFKNGIVLYRSHYNDQLGVTMEAVDYDGILNGLNVRLQIPMEEKIMHAVFSMAEIEGASIDDPGVDFLKSLGYDVNVVGMGLIEPDDPIVDRPSPEPERPRDEKPRPVDDAVVVDSDRGEPIDSVIDTPPVDARPVRTMSILLSRDEVRLTIVDFESEDRKAVDFILNIMDSQSISSRVKEDIRQIANFYGFGAAVLNQLEENTSVREYINLVEPVNIKAEDFNLNSAMKTELEWLRDNGVVAGLTDQDIADISAIAKPGMAGWNSRIVHSDGRWFPYYETADPILIRIMEEVGGEPPAIDMEIPDGVAEFPTASVSPTDKAITKWGKIKRDL